MSEVTRNHRHKKSLKSLLLYWIVGSGAISALLFAVIANLFLHLGVLLKIKGEFERLVSEHVLQLKQDPTVEFPKDDFFISFRSLDEIPAEVKEIFIPQDYKHGHFDFFVDIDSNESNIQPEGQFYEMCDGRACQLYFFYSYHLPNGKWVYLLSGLSLTEAEDEERQAFQMAVFCIALLIIGIFILVALLLFRKIGQPVQDIAQWAAQFNISDADKAPPSFHYTELNTVAEKLNEAFLRTAESIEKEHRFLQYASHELRTPIAVASGNLELLDKLPGIRGLSKGEREAIQRIDYSVRDMRLLTETLLWLNRSDAITPPVESINLLGLCKSSVSNNQYLLHGKLVEVEVCGKPVYIDVPPTFCSIIISNLIRNAFQHTHSGGVKISVEEHVLEIFNWEKITKQENDATQEHGSYSNVGFGLGLSLVEQVAARMAWEYEVVITPSGHLCSLRY